MDIEDQVALITGGGSGMGAATAEWLTGLGAKVAIVDVDSAKAASVAEKIHSKHYQCDVTDSENVEMCLADITDDLGVPRILINCAGICPAKRIVGKEGPMPLENFNKVIKINLVGTFNVMRLVADAMSKQEPVNDDGERGVIINTASIAAYEGQIGQAAYSASKSGIIGMTLPAARELARFGIRVMAIAPGIVLTPMMQLMPENVQESLAAQVPFPSRLANPTEFSSLVQHIIENHMLNGSVIRLDGAMRMAAV